MSHTNVFYGYSPLHLSIFRNLVKAGDNVNWLFVFPNTNLKISSSNVNHIIIDNIFSTSNPLKKFISLFKFRYHLKRHNVKINIFYSCNELSPFSVFIEKHFKITNGIIVDEGFLKGAVLKEEVLTRYNIKLFLRVLLTFSLRKRFKSSNFNTLITYNPDYFIGILNNNWNVIHINNVLTEKESLTISSFYDDSFIFILTSPLTENHNSRYTNQEIDILKSLVTLNQEFRFVIKPHYRENYDKKYEELLQLSNIEFIRKDLISVPVQNINFESHFVVGFHSSALKHIFLGGNNNVFTLSNFVNSKHSRSIFNSLTEDLCHFKKYEDFSKILQSTSSR